MALSVVYRGYRIVAAPNLSPNSRYSNNVNIERHIGPHVRMRKFDGSVFLGSQEEAERKAIQLGKRVIDGDVRGCSVDDL
jgi:hypothetical protein